MFFKSKYDHIYIKLNNDDKHNSYNLTNNNSAHWSYIGFKDIISWSYTYDGEYIPIIKEPVPTPAQLKIKELKETIANASKQLQELEEMGK